MLTLFEGIRLVCLVSMIVLWSHSPRPGRGEKDLDARSIRQPKGLRNAIALLVLKANALETQRPLTSTQTPPIKSLEDQITVARSLETLFPM
jgi:hypothetical protein